MFRADVEARETIQKTEVNMTFEQLVDQTVKRLCDAGYHAYAGVTATVASGPFVLPREAIIVAERDGYAHVRIISDAYKNVTPETLRHFVVSSIRWSVDDTRQQYEDWTNGYRLFNVHVVEYECRPDQESA
jgi:hypothetical protein